MGDHVPAVTDHLAFLSRRLPARPKKPTIQLESVDLLGNWTPLRRRHTASQVEWLMATHPDRYRYAEDQS